jgi:hypothetical protein
MDLGVYSASNRNFSGGEGRSMREANNLTGIYEPIV